MCLAAPTDESSCEEHGRMHADCSVVKGSRGTNGICSTGSLAQMPPPFSVHIFRCAIR